MLAQLSPVVAKALVLPSDDGTGLNERQGILSGRPELREPCPEQTSGWAKSRAMDSLLIHGKLVPQRKIFQAQRGMRPEQRSHEGQECRNHRRYYQRPHRDGPWKGWKYTGPGWKREREKSSMFMSLDFRDRQGFCSRNYW
jgi:hypothetical protein